MNKDVRNAALKNLGSDFSGYEGQEEANRDARRIYTGYGDPALQFTGGSSSFTDEDKSNKTYSLTIRNMGASAVDRVLALHPGYLTNVADMKDASGNQAAAIVADGTIINTSGAEVTCVGKPQKISHLQAFLNTNPTRFTGLKMLVNNSDQFEQDIYIQKLSPFVGLGYETINPGLYKNSSQTDDKRVEIPLQNFQVDNQSLIMFTLKAGREVTFTFNLGAIKNAAAELHAKASIAREGVMRKYY